MDRFIAALVVCLVVVSSSTASQYVVAPGGSNENPGTAALPWQTLQHAADSVAAGDRVTVRPGEYSGFHLTASGTSAMPIEFAAESGAVITSTNPVTIDGINLEGASHVVIDGFEVVGMPRAGVRSVGPYSGGQQAFAEFVTIRNVTSRDNGKWGILTGFVNDLLIENNRTSGSIDEHGIYVGNSGDRPTIRGNEIWGNNANGIHINADQFSGLDGVIEEAQVSGNVIYDNGQGGGSGINLDGVKNSRIENNLIYNSHASGISLYQIDGAEPSTGNVVVGNTIHQAADGRWALNLQNGAANTTVANNIFLSDHNFRGAIDASADSLSGLVSDYNVMISRFTTDDASSVMTLAEWQTNTGQDLHSQVATASELFVAPDEGDYRLLATATARDMGWQEWTPDVDLRGVARPIGTGPDIGALEWIPTGDANADGQVNLADYTIVRNHLGATDLAPFTPVDVNNDGTVDAADLAIWKERFGESAAGIEAGTSAVPEPRACGLVLGALLGLGWLRSDLTKRLSSKLPEHFGQGVPCCEDFLI